MPRIDVCLLRPDPKGMPFRTIAAFCVGTSGVNAQGYTVLSGECISEGEVDEAAAYLKQCIDAAAQKAKRAIAADRRPRRR